MKKKNNKKTIPSYAFGMDQLSNYLGGANVLGSAISGLSEEGSTGSAIGNTLGGAASLAGAGLSVGGPIGAAVGGGLGLVTGLVSSIKRKKQMQETERKQRTLNQTKIGMNNAAEASGEYWDDNSLAYTFENGGILPDLAYLDNNEIIRDNGGNIAQVPNTQPGTDNHLVDASNLESVLSDKIKRPGTKRTFAKEGKILSKMTKPSKGTDIFAENTNRLNKINANKAYNNLLAEQEAVKAARGIKPKVKGIPAYQDGKGKTVPDVMRKMNSDTYSAYGDFFNELVGGLNKFGEALGYFPKKIFGPLINNKNITSSVEDVRNTKPSYGTFTSPKFINSGIELNPNKRLIQTYGSAPAFYSETSNETPIQSFDDTQGVQTPLNTNLFSNETTPATSTTTSPLSSKTTKTTRQLPQGPNPINTRQDPGDLLPTNKPRVNTSMKIDWDGVVKGIDPKKANEIYKERKKYYQDLTDDESNSYSPDWLSLAPTIYNTLQGLRNPEEEPLVLNPYAGAVRNTMARRRMNIEPARLANSRSRAISNYNLANVNANTGSNLAARTQAAVGEYATNADMYAAKQNADNAYLGDYANTLNNLGQQFVQSETMYNDLNARNRAAARNYGATAVSQLGKWSQVNKQMSNLYNKDLMMLPFLEDFLSQGYTQDKVNNLRNRTKNRV